jgi:hypothetical protein
MFHRLDPKRTSTRHTHWCQSLAPHCGVTPTRITSSAEPLPELH